MSGNPGAPATGAGAASPSSPASQRVRWIAPLLLAVVAAASLAWRSPSLACGDLCSYYAAGLLARAGEPAAAFDSTALDRRHREVHDLGQRTGPFLYSPLFLAPAALLAGDPLPEAARRHRIAGAALLGLGLFVVLLALERLAAQVAVAAAFALAHAAWVQLVYANWSFALFAFAAVVMLGLVRGRGRLAIVAGALAIHLKPFVLFAFVPLAAARRRLVVAVGTVALLLVGLALPFTGSAPWTKFGSFLAGRGAAGVTPFYSKSSLAANVARLGTDVRDWVAPRQPVDSLPVKAIFWAGLPLLLWGARRLRERPAAAFAFGLAWILLFVPQIWEHTEILLFAALPALARRSQLLLAAALALTFSYNDAQQRLLAAALSGESGESAVRALLWLYPLLALWVLVTALGAAKSAARAPAVAGGAALLLALLGAAPSRAEDVAAQGTRPGNRPRQDVELALPLPPREADPARLARARSILGDAARLGRLGPFPLLTDVAEPALLARASHLAETFDATYRERYGLAPIGVPRETVVLFAREADYRRYQGDERGIGEIAGAAGLAGGGVAATFVEERSDDEVLATLAHEWAHLANRRALGPALPSWLDEGIAEDMGAARIDAEGRLLPGSWARRIRRTATGWTMTGGEASLRELHARLFPAGDARPGELELERLLGLDWSAFAAEGDAPFHYAVAGVFLRLILSDSSLATATRGWLGEVATGAPPEAEGLRAALGLPWSELESRLRRWVATELAALEPVPDGGPAQVR